MTRHIPQSRRSARCTSGGVGSQDALGCDVPPENRPVKACHLTGVHLSSNANIYPAKSSFLAPQVSATVTHLTDVLQLQRPFHVRPSVGSLDGELLSPILWILGHSSKTGSSNLLIESPVSVHLKLRTLIKAENSVFTGPDPARQALQERREQ